MKRPYRYKLTCEWSGDCLSEGHQGYRTRSDGTRENFRNNVYDGQDPLPAVRAERAAYEFMDKHPDSKSVKKLVIIVTGDQAKE